jgi:flagellar biosynthesis chaperone FliJ
MSDIQALREIETIRIRRVEQAEDSLRVMQQRLRQAEQALQEAQAALADYLLRLPQLIEQLYADCIQHLISREVLADKIHDEAQLRSRTEDFKAKVTEAEKNLASARQAVADAQQQLNKERVKLDALRELIKNERQLVLLGQARAQAKVLDDLAGSQFVRKLRQAA